MTALLDTNVMLRHLLGDHAEHSPRATAVIRRIQSGELSVRISDFMVFETVFTLERSYRQPRERIRDAILRFLELPAVQLPGKTRYRDVFALYLEQGLPLVDAFHITMMEQLGIDEIISFDRDYDGHPGIRRIEP